MALSHHILFSVAKQSLALLPLDSFSSDSDSCSEDEESSCSSDDGSCSSDDNLHSEPSPLSSVKGMTSSTGFPAKAANSSRKKVLIEEIPDRRKQQDSKNHTN